VSSVVSAKWHALALSEDGLVYAWGRNEQRVLLGDPDIEEQLLPKPVEALRGVRVSSVAVHVQLSYAVADTGELWAWGLDTYGSALGQVEQGKRPVPKPMESLQGVKIDAVSTCGNHTLAVADDGSVYACSCGATFVQWIRAYSALEN
jgi:alpha-tubulin suppressor-like RCC1 family protein